MGVVCSHIYANAIVRPGERGDRGGREDIAFLSTKLCSIQRYDFDTTTQFLAPLLLFTMKLIVFSFFFSSF